MKILLTSVVSLVLGFLSVTATAQSSYMVTLFGDTIVCDSISAGMYTKDGETKAVHHMKEVVLTVTPDELHVYSNGFDKGRVIMSGEDFYLTLFVYVTENKHKREIKRNHVFIVDKKSLKVLHEYSNWYMDKGQMVIRYFPVDEEKCPKYAQAMNLYMEACTKATAAPSLEAEALIRAWNECYPIQ